MAWRARPQKPCHIVVQSIEIVGELSSEECGDVCPTEALRFERDHVVAEPERCLACLACMALCGPSRVRIVTDWICPE
ncbi:hypothetical protein Pyrde_0969 [Pyrodictium delaneyi]|nr:hypothetical protein [Pyrodictium delaneyi]ALL01017.1 hypothetical protein Pyrde_0969 [Pyrodictium delaneyi]